jgi:DNA primase catalytic subunit
VASTPARFWQARAKERVWGVRASFGDEERRMVLDFYKGRGGEEERGAPGSRKWPAMAPLMAINGGRNDGSKAPLLAMKNERRGVN